LRWCLWRSSEFVSRWRKSRNWNTNWKIWINQMSKQVIVVKEHFTLLRSQTRVHVDWLSGWWARFIASRMQWFEYLVDSLQPKLIRSISEISKVSRTFSGGRNLQFVSYDWFE
jgi:hypothetical protein